MRAHPLIYIQLAMLAAACLLASEIAGRAQTSPAPLLVKTGQKVVFMGDSITGMGWGDTGGYVHLVVDGLGTLGVQIVPVPAGVGGNKSDDMLARLNTDALSQKPDWLLLSCGVNDVWSRRIDLDTFKKNITSIVDQAQAAGIRVMILTPTPIYELEQTEFSRLSDYVAFMVQLAHDRKLPLADENAAYFAYMKAHPASPGDLILTIDGVHPNPDGHQILAQTILEAFGVTPEQMTQVKAAWNALPDGANLPIGFGVKGTASVTLAQQAALQQIAAQKKIPFPDFLRGLFMEALRDTMIAHGNLDGYSEDTLSHDAQPLFAQEIAKLAPPAAGDTPSSATVVLTTEFGFRGTTSLSIPQYEKFKQIALSRKLSKHQLTISVFMAGIRDTMIAKGDISNVHQDNISHDSWPLYDKNVADLVK
jgi:lysophospholipase L1-like esterase